MTELLPLALAFVGGLLLSAFYFGGLWWTVRRGVVSKHPAIWFSGSVLLRTSIALVGFYVVGHGHWDRLVVCLLGFVVARVFVVWRTRSALDIRPRPAREAGHAA
jgi:F1F0 ATPase subunit 2